MILNKMWCVGFFATALMVSVVQGKENTDVRNVHNLIDQEKRLLIDNVTAIVKPHLSPAEMSRLNALLQDLASKVKVQNLFEIHKKLKSKVTVFVVMAFMGGKNRTVSSESTNPSLQRNLQRILEKISLSQYEEFIRTHAAQLSTIIAQTLATDLPADCLPALVDTIATISNLQRPEELQKALEAFVSNHSVALSAL